MNLLDISPEKLCEILHTDRVRGLDDEAVQKNRKEFGSGELSKPLFSPKAIVRSLFSDVLFCMFLALCILSLFTENHVVALVCLCTAAFCYCAFFLFCAHSARPLAAAEKHLEGRACVIRQGKRLVIPARELVPGDLVVLKRGDAVLCDGILLSAEELHVCQVQIDGHAESKKYPYEDAVSAKQRDRALVCYGSVVTAGSGVLLVCNTGKNTKKTSLSAHALHRLPRPLQEASDHARALSLILTSVLIVLFLVGIFTGTDAYSGFFLLVAIGAAVLPELTVSVTRLLLVLSVTRLKRRGLLIRNYACLDALLKTDRIVVDSASYFLDEAIRPANYFYANCPRSVREVSEGLFTLISYSRLCCEDKPKKKEQMWYGKSSVDAAICRTAPDFGIDAEYLSHSFLPVSRLPFEEVRGFSSALVLQHENCYQLVRGRPTEVLDRCTHLLQEKRSVPLSASAKARLYQAADQMAAAGEVVVAVARRYFRSVPADLNLADAGYLTFVGFLTFHTPIRAESAEAASVCQKNGVQVILSTDNDPDATLGIARNMGFFPEGTPAGILTGEKARRLSPSELSEAMKHTRVFCALSPAARRAAVLAQKEEGHTVLACVHTSADTLTQDAADVSAVCVRENHPELLPAADLVLTSERFELLPEAMRLSRTVFFNSLRILRFSMLITAALFSAALGNLFFAASGGFLQPLSVLFLGLIFLLFCAVAMSRDRERVTTITPVGKDSFLSSSVPSLSVYALICGVTEGLCCTLTYFLCRLFCHPAEAAGAALFTLFFSTLFVFFGARKTEPIWKPQFSQNLVTYAAIPLCLVLTFVLIGLSGVRTHLGLLIPPPVALPIPLILSLLPLLAGEIQKTVKLRRTRK